MKRSRAVLALVPLSVAGIAASGAVPWEELTPADVLHDVVTRFASVDGHKVYYPTPTEELAQALETRGEPEALRALADARFELGQRPAAAAALRRWAEGAGPEAWAEAAQWAADRLEMPFAFEAAERALAGLTPDAARGLHDDRIRWADRHPGTADALALRRARAEAFPADAAAFEDYLRALDAAKRFDDAEAALAATTVVPPERRLMLRSDLLADRGELGRAVSVLDGGIDAGFGPDFRKAFAERVEKGAPELPARWRAQLEKGFDAAALTRLSTYFQGQGRGDAAADLLREIERREERRLARTDLRLLARLWAEIDAVPEAFRAELAASQSATPQEQTAALAPLARLALRAGGRPLAWGTYNDEPYRWAARLDRTPGFWTGGLSFLLTGQDWKEALAHLESESLPERTFATARALHDELVRRAPGSSDLPALRAALMERHVERGEGKEALALLPLVEPAGGDAADDARRIALLALRQVEAPIAEEARLFRARLQRAAADGTRPSLAPPAYSEYDVAPEETWRRVPAPDDSSSYRQLLDDAVGRLDQRDPTHQASVALLLGEMDRMPQAEALWLDLAQRLEGWNLDDELGPRYEQALTRFKGPGWWPAAARWYARRSRYAELDRLARQLASGFRGAELFARVDAPQVRLELPEQPRVGQRVRLAPWADWVRLKALERFPHSSRVFREAQGHLQARSDWDRELGRVGAAALAKRREDRVIVDDALLEERGWAVLASDAARRESFFAAAMTSGSLEARLGALENEAATPVRDRLLFEGWSRLSRFEQAAAPADRLAGAYPGDEPLARSVLSLHRSLAGLDTAHAAPARALVARTAPALVDPAPLWTELGELEEEGGRPENALAHWRHILEDDPRNPDRVSELATLLWDYGHIKAALDVVEGGRERLGRPRFFAFETGVLREETRDIRGAVREYLAALLPEESTCYCSAFETDQRSLRRLAQLLGRPRVLALIEADIASLTPGRAEDERRLAALLPLATITAPEPGLDWDADDWIDGQDMPNDPVGRAERDARRDAARPDENAAIARVADVLLARAEALAPAATNVEFAEALESWARPLLEARDAERAISFEITSLRRRAALATSPADRVSREIDLARRLVSVGRHPDADAVWAALPARLRALPEGASRMHAEAAYPQHLESEGQVDAAAAAWRDLAVRYPWSLGLLQDRLAFLNRAGRAAEARGTLEAATAAMAGGHRERFLEQLTREALEAGDRTQARRALERLLKEPSLAPQQRLGADHLLARLALKDDPKFDPATLVGAEAPKLPKDMLSDLYAQLAQAAEREQAWATGTSLWIEALNRRLERDWLAKGALAASRAGRLPEFLKFFETQQGRSPRDVRWAVAVREIRRHADDAAGAVEAAKAAVAVKPDRELLWREAVDLLVRADRVREAADYLEGWNTPRPADESVVAWRGRLYARVGDGEKVLAIERATLAAYARTRPADEDELAERQARAARRLVEFGYPRLALRLLAPTGDMAALAESRLGEREKADLALANDQFLRLMRNERDSEEFLEAGAAALRDSARPEQRDEALAWFVRQLFPTPGGAGDDRALQALWPTIDAAGLARGVRLAVGERLAKAASGPWQASASTAFYESVGDAAIARRRDDGNREVWRFGAPPLEALWVRDLVRRDRDQELAAYLDARLASLLADAQATTPLPAGDAAFRDWTGWLTDRNALEVWARGLRARPDRIEALAATLAARNRWDRLWALGAKRWDVAPLVALVPDAARSAWFGFWDTAATRAANPVEERVAVAVGRLVTGDAGAETDPLVAKLRGPRTVGESLTPGPQWQWTELGKDGGPWPAPLWGGDPGESWFALETLARFRAHDAEAARVPFETPLRGKETQRALLAAKLAERLGDDAYASEILESRASTDVAIFAMRLRLLVRLGRSADAASALEAAVRKEQQTLGEDRLRAFEALAASESLRTPLDLLDPATPLPPALLAYLYDARGAQLAARFHTDDPVGFRAALARRFEGRSAGLSAEQVRFALHELWANEAGELPRAGLKRLGGLWPQAGEWLSRQMPADRSAALQAVAALPDASGVETLARSRGLEQEDATRLLLVRAALGRSDAATARGLFDAMLASLDKEEPLTYTTVEAVASDEEDAEWTDDGAETEPEAAEATDALAAQLETWRQAFRDARQEALVDDRLAAFLAARRDNGSVPVAEWRLAFRIARTDAQRAELDKGLEHAWLRGDGSPEGLPALVEMLSEQAPALAPRWLARWPASVEYSETSRRARVLVRLKDEAAAAALLAGTRARTLWSATDEVRAFDAWRRVATEVSAKAAPAAWTTAAAFWKRSPGDAAAGLEAHLRAHPLDLLAARTILRSVDAAPEESAQRARVALAAPALESLGSPWADDAVVRLRIARGLLAASPAAARTALGDVNARGLADDLVRRRFRAADIDAALSDVARLATRGADTGTTAALLAILDDRKATGLVALRAELAALRGPEAAPTAFRLEGGRPRPWRPRDLDWTLVTRILDAEGQR